MIEIWISLIILGLISSYTDIRSGKILNRVILIFSLLGLLFLFFENMNLVFTSINLLISLIVGFVFYYFGLWNAGDGKLFTVYSLIIPLDTYSTTLFYYPGFHLLVNSFSPIFVFMFVLMVFKTNRMEKVTSLRNTFNISKLMATFLSVFLTFQIFSNNISTYLIVPVSISLVAFFFIMNKYFSNYLNWVIVVLDVLSVFLLGFSFYTLLFSIIAAIILLLLRFFVRDLGKGLFTSEVDVDELKRGDIMVKNKAMEFLLNECTFSEGLSKSDIDRLKKMKAGKILIHRTIPFAPFIFLGVLLTLLLRSNIIIYLFNLL